MSNADLKKPWRDSYKFQQQNEWAMEVVYAVRMEYRLNMQYANYVVGREIQFRSSTARIRFAVKRKQHNLD